MKKLTIVLLFLFGFTSLEITAQTESDIPLDKGANGMIYRNTGGADRGSTSNVFGTQGQWTSDLTISEKSSSQALAMGWEGTAHSGMGATGWASFTGGAYNRASGVGSVAFGFHNVAGPTSSDVNAIDGNNIGQTAFGYGTLASGNASFTSGQGTEGSGSFSTSAGYYTTASDYGSFVIGSWNLSGSTVTSATAFSASAPAFVIGNGTANNSRSDAFKILFNGTTTIAGSVTASAFIGDGSQLTNLPSGTNGSDGNGIASTTDNNNGTFTLTFDDNTTFTTSDLTGATGTTGPTGNPGANGTNGNDGAQGSQGIQGETGATGPTGNAGANGTNGANGANGTNGNDGAQGSQGIQGETGATGPTGNAGADGADGTNGTDGAQGIQGEIGATGPTGNAGANGTDGTDGTDGAQGIQGETGATGPTGNAGADGTNGTDGTDGAQGNQGIQGEIGATGPTGNAGAAGAAGADGAQGIQGETGATGLTGPAGADGTNGNDGAQGIQGETGEAGPQGIQGEAGTTGTGDYNDLLNIPISFNDNNLNGLQSPTNIATGDYSTALGTNNIASGGYSTALGATNTASGYASTSMGDSNWASGRASTAIGAGTIAQDYGMFSMGIWSEPLNDSNPEAEDFALTNTAFLIGNGLDADNRSNAVQILFDGTTTIAGDLNINSDARLKANIISLGATLYKLLQIDGKTYTMKKDSDDKKKIGLLAQDIEKVFPELVTETNNIKSVNYQGLIPVLINAMKEQQSEIDKLKEKENNYLEQEKRLEKLEQIISNMEK